MKNYLLKIFDIREGEEQRALLMFFYIFLIIASLLIIKPVRNSLFLSRFGVQQLPYAFLLVALAAVFVSTVYSRISLRFRLNYLIRISLLFSIGSLLLIWYLLHLNFQAGWFYYLFYVWAALFAVLITSQFWLLANYVFNAREARRLFGFIGAGAISGGIFGGYFTKFFAPVFGSVNLLFFCILFLSVSLLIAEFIWKQGARRTYRERLLQQKRIRQTQIPENAVSTIIKSRHLIYLSALVGVGVIAANLVDYQYSAIASAQITDKDQLSAFFGFWLSNLSIGSLLIQLFLTGRILRVFGVSISLLFLPISILIGVAAVLFNPALWAAVLLKVSDGSFKNSVNKAGLELLVLPVASHIKNRIKSYIDVLVDSLATGIGGILLILAIGELGWSVQQIGFLIAGLLVLWILLIFRVKSEYLNTFRLALEKRSIDLDEQNISLQDATVLSSLKDVLEGN
ncbi:MAG: Npt1/Npt2 family nucleotide transporter, partial [Calditrichia bacterium]